jgi:ribosomal protein S6--L-glutamate ligase
MPNGFVPIQSGLAMTLLAKICKHPKRIRVKRKLSMILSFHPCFLGDTLVILGDGTLDSHDLRHIRAAEVIILPQHCTSGLYRACKGFSAQIFPNYAARFEYPGKIGQSLLFKKYECPHPETLQWTSVKAFKEAYEGEGNSLHRMPFLLKENETHEAEGIHTITDRRALEASLEDLKRLEGRESSGFISQQLITTEGNVLRVVVIGSRTITYWKRAQETGQMITTINRGAKIDRAWRPDLQEKARMETEGLVAATGMNLAAIDFVFDLTQPDPQPLFLEINYIFGRRGLGGSMRFYRLLSQALQEWLAERGFDTNSLTFL